jgi:hypothetical protein
LKDRFEKVVKSQGVSMTFLLRSFMERYVEKPNIAKIHFDDNALDALWSTKSVSNSIRSLSSTLEAK